MNEVFWMFLASLLAKPAIANWLIKRAQRTPYMHILSPTGDETYMWRWWLLNPYTRKTGQPRWSWLPFSVRIHHIARRDYDDHCHDHPWDARTIILKGSYEEKRLATGEQREQILDACLEPHEQLTLDRSKIVASEYFSRTPGTTAKLGHGQYHSITEVAPGGAVTLFITWKYQGVWGFLVDGVKIPWRTYLGLAEHEDLPDMKKKVQP